MFCKTIKKKLLKQFSSDIETLNKGLLKLITTKATQKHNKRIDMVTLSNKQQDFTHKNLEED